MTKKSSLETIEAACVECGESFLVDWDRELERDLQVIETECPWCELDIEIDLEREALSEMRTKGSTRDTTRRTPQMDAIIGNHRHTLRGIEAELRPQLSEVSLLRELLPADDRCAELAAAIHDGIETEGLRCLTAFLRDEVATSVSVYLVWKGIHSYDSGDYWDGIADLVEGGLPLAWRTKWGKLFEQTLISNDLPRFSELGGHRYVTPILLHGGIPDDCVAGLMDRLIVPVLRGRMTYSGSARELIEDWNETSLIILADKPIRRFLDHGGKVAEDFLDRAIEASRDLESGESLVDSAAYGLPWSFLAAMEKWLQGRSEAASSKTASHSISRFRRPQFVFDPEARAFTLTLPTQRIEPEGPTGAFSVELNLGEKTTRAPLLASLRGGVIETERRDFLLPPSIRHCSVHLWHEDELIKKWSILESDHSKGLLAFDGETSGLLPPGRLEKEDVWLIVDARVAVDSGGRVFEEAPLPGDLMALHVHLDGSLLCLTGDGQNLKMPVAIASGGRMMLAAAGRVSWPVTKVGGDPVYSEPPTLVLGELGARLPRALSISVISNSAVSRITELAGPELQDLVEIKDGMTAIGLSRWLSGVFGSFVLSVRGTKLGDDSVFRFSIVPGLSIKASVDDLFDSGALSLSMNIKGLGGNIFNVEPPITLDENNRLIVPRDYEWFHVEVAGVVEGKAVPLDLEVRSPQIRWAFHDSGDIGGVSWKTRPLKVSLAELQGMSDPTLLLYADLPHHCQLAIALRGTSQRTVLKHRDGRASIAMAPFIDSIRESGQLVSHLSLQVEGLPAEPRELGLLDIETFWIVEQPRFDPRKQELRWTESASPSGRVVRVWALDDQTPVLEMPVKDGEAKITVSPELLDRRGLVQLEFAVSDEWSEAPVRPDAESLNVWGYVIDQSGAMRLERTEDPTTAAIAAIDGKKRFDRDLLLRISSNPGFVGKFLRELSLRLYEEPTSESLANIAKESETAELLAEMVTTESLVPDERVVDAVAHAMSEKGYLIEPWSPSTAELMTRPLYRSRRGSGTGAGGGRRLVSLCSHALWRDASNAAKFFEHFKGLSGEIRFGNFHLGEVQGLTRAMDEEMIRWKVKPVETKRRRGRRKKPAEHGDQSLLVPLRSLAEVRLTRFGPALSCALCAGLLRASAGQRVALSPDDRALVEQIGRTLFVELNERFSAELKWAEEAFS